MSPIVIDRTFGHRSTMSTSTITSASARTRGDGRIVRKSGASRDMPLGDAQKRIPPRPGPVPVNAGHGGNPLGACTFSAGR